MAINLEKICKYYRKCSNNFSVDCSWMLPKLQYAICLIVYWRSKRCFSFIIVAWYELQIYKIKNILQASKSSDFFNERDIDNLLQNKFIFETYLHSTGLSAQSNQIQCVVFFFGVIPEFWFRKKKKGRISFIPDIKFFPSPYKRIINNL